MLSHCARRNRSSASPTEGAERPPPAPCYSDSAQPAIAHRNARTLARLCRTHMPESIHQQKPPGFKDLEEKSRTMSSAGGVARQPNTRAKRPETEKPTMESITTSIDIAASAEKIYRAITTTEGERAWWTTDCEVGKKVGDQATFRFDPMQGKTGTTEMRFSIDRLD